MHFSTATIAAAAAFFSSVSAAPAPGTQSQKINSRELEARGPSAAVGAWTNAGRLPENPVDDEPVLQTQYACEESGQWAPNDKIFSGAQAACDDLISNLVPDTVVAMDDWVTHLGDSMEDGSGGTFVATYRMFYNTAKSPTATNATCVESFQRLTSDYCMGKNENGDNTKGGEMSVGEDDDYTMYGIDPNDD